VEIPETRYAKTADDIHIAYQVFGNGPADLVYVHRFVNTIGYMWEVAPFAEFLQRLGTMARVLCLDPRGAGMSDPVPLDSGLSLEARARDVGTVMDAVGWRKASLMGTNDGGSLCALFATIPGASRPTSGVPGSLKWKPTGAIPTGCADRCVGSHRPSQVTPLSYGA
jgi:pimeloyl-ACP methyl ester carboxylesterase